jgi:molecular chaperone GrpE
LLEEEESEEVQPRKEKDDEEREVSISDGETVEGDSGKGGGRAQAHAGLKPKHERAPGRSRKELEREVQSLSEELEKVSTELQETKDRFLRSLADFDNYRKRIGREREQLVQCANEDLIRRVLEVVDNLERALAAASETEDLQGFKKGVELIDQHLKDILTKEGLCPIACVGEAFDPNLHEAVMAIEKEGEEPEKVIEEIQKGYTLDGRLIRPSKVVVSK